MSPFLSPLVAFVSPIEDENWTYTSLLARIPCNYDIVSRFFLLLVSSLFK